MEILNGCSCGLQFQMPFVQLCKSAACGFVSCCDRRSPSKSERYPPDYKAHAEIAPPSKHNFNRLKTWPKSTQKARKSRLTGNGKAISEREQQEDNPTDKEPERTSEDVRQRLFTYDIVLLGKKREKPVYRRLLLDFQLTIDAISDEIPRLVNLPISPYNGSEILLPSGRWAKPIGTLKVTWKLYKQKRKFETKFLVIEHSHFDMLIGRPSIQKYKLWEEDRNIQKRLQCD